MRPWQIAAGFALLGLMGCSGSATVDAGPTTSAAPTTTASPDDFCSAWQKGSESDSEPTTLAAYRSSVVESTESMRRALRLLPASLQPDGEIVSEALLSGERGVKAAKTLVEAQGAFATASRDLFTDPKRRAEWNAAVNRIEAYSHKNC